MTTKYLEIDSTFRNRNIWPLPGKFQLLLAKSAPPTAQTADDPVSLATPVVAWKSNYFAMAPSTTTITGSISTTGFGAANSPTVVIFSAQNLHHELNYYKNCVATFTQNECGCSRQIRSRVVSYQYLGNDEAKLVLESPINNLSFSDTITLSDPTDFTVSKIFVPGSTTIYEDCILYDETTTRFEPITNFDEMTNCVTVSSLSGCSQTDAFSIRRQPPVFIGNILSATGTNIVIGLIDIDILGSFIRVKPTYPSVSPAGEIRRIISYNPSTSTAIIATEFSADPTGFNYEILKYNFDNFNPFVYIGSRQCESKTCNIRLVNLSLPSTLLKCGLRGTIRRYPYVYVKLAPINTSINDILSSNNPNASPMLFRAVLGDNHSKESAFVNLTGDDTIQRIKFQIETDFDFSVSLPSGEIFQSASQEFYSPQQPNPSIQISALFEIKS